MAEFILKDRNGKDRTFNKETIYVQGTDGELKSFTHGAGNPVVQPLNVTENGEYTVPDGVDGFAPVTVNVPDIPAVIHPLSITENGTYTAPANVDGYNPIVVNVASSGGSEDVRYVTFMSYDGLVEYGKKAVAVGDDCADPIARGIFSTPTRESDAQYNYTFYGWATSPNGAADADALKAVEEDKTVYANFAAAVRYYTITYYDEDGTTVLKTESLAYGATPSYEPSKEGFKISGWNPAITAVTGDASYSVQWKELSGLNFLSMVTPSESAFRFAVSNDGKNIIAYKNNQQANYVMRYETTSENAVESKITTPTNGYTQDGIDLNYNGTVVRVIKSESGTYYIDSFGLSGSGSRASAGGTSVYISCSPSTNLYCYRKFASSKYSMVFSNGSTISNVGGYSAVCITKNDKYVVYSDYSGKIGIVDIAQKTVLKTITSNITSSVTIDVNEDGTKLVISGGGKFVEVYSLETFEKICDFSNILTNTASAVFAGDFVVVASGSTVRAFEIVDSTPVENFDIPAYSGGTVTRMSSSHNKNYVAIYDGTNIELWGKA